MDDIIKRYRERRRKRLLERQKRGKMNEDKTDVNGCEHDKLGLFTEKQVRAVYDAIRKYQQNSNNRRRLKAHERSEINNWYHGRHDKDVGRICAHALHGKGNKESYSLIFWNNGFDDYKLCYRLHTEIPDRVLEALWNGEIEI